ncbi:hypothetical protein DFH27DRAFT_121034 [Peziza echinospora]|nr:hypothetical protein DFH27DRAFT_121034 [Peziza echinospora]
MSASATGNSGPGRSGDTVSIPPGELAAAPTATTAAPVELDAPVSPLTPPGEFEATPTAITAVPVELEAASTAPWSPTLPAELIATASSPGARNLSGPRQVPNGTEIMERREVFDFVASGSGYDNLPGPREPRFLESYNYQVDSGQDLFARYYEFRPREDDLWRVPVATLVDVEETANKLMDLVTGEVLQRLTQVGEPVTATADRYSKSVHAIELEKGTIPNEEAVLERLFNNYTPASPLPGDGNAEKNDFGTFFRGHRQKQDVGKQELQELQEKQKKEKRKRKSSAGFKQTVESLPVESVPVSRLSFRVPYITINSSESGPVGGSGTKQLSAFISDEFGENLDLGNDDITTDFTIERARFTVFNDDIILVARTGPASIAPNGADLICPHQIRAWGYHYFVTMIASTLEFHDRAMLGMLRKEVTKHELKFNAGPETLSETDVKARKRDSLQLAHLMIVVDMQINLLRNLLSFLRSANPDLKSPDFMNSSSILNLRLIPVLTDGSEPMSRVLAVLDNLIEARIEVKCSLEALLSRIMKLDKISRETQIVTVLVEIRAGIASANTAQAAAYQNNLTQLQSVKNTLVEANQIRDTSKTAIVQAINSTSEVQTQKKEAIISAIVDGSNFQQTKQKRVFDGLLESNEQQRISSKALAEEFSFQGKQISAFTFINIIFLPLNFFAILIAMKTLPEMA